MHPQLEVLLQIQDLKAKRKDLVEIDDAAQVQEEEFGLDLESATRQIEEKIDELVQELEPQVRSRYGRLATGLNRVVVPAINGVCYGCFVAVPTAVASDPEERAGLPHCGTCGRFLYFVD
jgi:predicted  nucleic acid-binding Zn-ribbon protein